MSLCHRDKLSVVISDRRYFMRHNQMGLGVDGRLDIIAHKACPFVTGSRGTGIRIGQRYLPSGVSFNCRAMPDSRSTSSRTRSSSAFKCVPLLMRVWKLAK